MEEPGRRQDQCHGDPDGAPSVSGAGSALCLGVTGAGTDTGLASGPKGGLEYHRGVCVVPEDKEGQQPPQWCPLPSSSSLSTGFPAPAVCVYCVPSLPSPSFPGQTGVYQPGYCFAPAARLFAGNKRERLFSPSHWVFVPHVPWLSPAGEVPWDEGLTQQQEVGASRAVSPATSARTGLLLLCAVTESLWQPWQLSKTLQKVG